LSRSRAIRLYRLNHRAASQDLLPNQGSYQTANVSTIFERVGNLEE
jgi:hypothetical protein